MCGLSKDAQVGTTAVGVERTASDECSPPPLELDAVASDDVFDGMRLFQSIRVDPPCTLGGASNSNGHASYAAVAISSGGRARSHRDGCRSSSLPPRSRWRQYEMCSRSRARVSAT